MYRVKITVKDKAQGIRHKQKRIKHKEKSIKPKYKILNNNMTIMYMEKGTCVGRRVLAYK